MVLNIKPLSDRVLIEPVAAETKLLQGFSFQTLQKKTTKGTGCSRKWNKEHK
jgi:chaperonin GroES